MTSSSHQAHHHTLPWRPAGGRSTPGVAHRTGGSSCTAGGCDGRRDGTAKLAPDDGRAGKRCRWKHFNLLDITCRLCRRPRGLRHPWNPQTPPDGAPGPVCTWARCADGQGTQLGMVRAAAAPAVPGAMEHVAPLFRGFQRGAAPWPTRT